MIVFCTFINSNKEREGFIVIDALTKKTHVQRIDESVFSFSETAIKHSKRLLADKLIVMRLIMVQWRIKAEARTANAG